MAYVSAKYIESIPGLVDYPFGRPTVEMADSAIQYYTNCKANIDVDVETLLILWRMIRRILEDEKNFRSEVYRRLADIENRFADRPL